MSTDDWLIESARKGMRPSPYDAARPEQGGAPETASSPAALAKQPIHSAAEWVRIYAEMGSAAPP